jgi:hypothetical protein
MARVIAFYVPARFRRIVTWIPPHQRGKVIPFRPAPSRPSYERSGWFGGLTALRRPSPYSR